MEMVTGTRTFEKFIPRLSLCVRCDRSMHDRSRENMLERNVDKSRGEQEMEGDFGDTAAKTGTDDAISKLLTPNNYDLVSFRHLSPELYVTGGKLRQWSKTSDRLSISENGAWRLARASARLLDWKKKTPLTETWRARARRVFRSSSRVNCRVTSSC